MLVNMEKASNVTSVDVVLTLLDKGYSMQDIALLERIDDCKSCDLVCRG